MIADGKILKERLDSFQIEQLTKFFDVRHKHPNDDVCDNNTDWGKFDLYAIWNHLLEEFFEVTNILFDSNGNKKAIEPIGINQLRQECVDVGNMAFLLAEVAKERGINEAFRNWVIR